MWGFGASKIVNDSGSCSKQDDDSHEASSEELRLFEQAPLVNEEVVIDPDDPAASHLSSFDWNSGKFKKTAIWLIGILQLLVSAVILFTSLASSKSYETATYRLFGMTKPPSSPTAKLETVRILLLLSGPAFVYSIIQVLTCFIPVFAMIFARARSLEKPGLKPRVRIDNILKMRRYLGLAVGGLVLSILAHYLYPRGNFSPLNGVKVDETNSVRALNDRIDAYMNMTPPNFFIFRVCLFISALWIMIFIEKAILLIVSHRYHRTGLGKRMKINDFALKVIKGVRRHLLSIGTVSDRKAADGALIFDGLGKAELGPEDFESFLDEDECKNFFDLLVSQDPESARKGKLDRASFIRAIDAVKREEDAINVAMGGSSKLLKKFDNLLMVIVYIAAVFILLAILEPPIEVLVSFAVSIVASLVFIFGGTAQNAFESMVFVLFTHPFDQNDWIVLSDGIMYQIRELGLISCSFLTQQNDIVYMTNSFLNGQPIINYKRSDGMSELIRFSVLPDTPREKFAELEKRLVEWLKKHPENFGSKTYFRNFYVTDAGHMTVECRVWHKFNFDDMTKKDHRTRLFVLELRDGMIDLGIKLSGPILPDSVVHRDVAFYRGCRFSHLVSHTQPRLTIAMNLGQALLFAYLLCLKLNAGAKYGAGAACAAQDGKILGEVACSAEIQRVVVSGNSRVLEVSRDSAGQFIESCVRSFGERVHMVGKIIQDASLEFLPFTVVKGGKRKILNNRSTLISVLAEAQSETKEREDEESQRKGEASELRGSVFFLGTLFVTTMIFM